VKSSENHTFIAETAVGFFVVAKSSGPYATIEDAQAELDSLERRLSDDGITEVTLQ
jgi:hypothetical protein